MRQVGVEELILGSRPQRGSGAPLGADWVDVLRDVPLFSSLSKRHVRRIAKLARERRFATGTTIVRKGQRGDAFYVILDGEATLGLPKRRNVRIKAGDFFGELALFDGQPRSATVTATTPVLAMSIARGPFLKLVADESDLALSLLKALSTRLREADEAAAR